MQTKTTTACLLFPELFSKPLVARFDQPHASSDGGAILLKAADRRLGLIEKLSAVLPDDRDPAKVAHDIEELLSQRVFAIACGYPDANDAARLGDDPVHKMLLDRDPVRGETLASQPTLSRFENSVGPKDLYRLGEVLAETILERHRRRRRSRAKWITVDLDVTDDPTHGAQQLSFFNGFYDKWCYLPLLAFVQFDRERDQHLVAALLRPGNASTSGGAIGLLKRILPRLRSAFPKARILVRLDAGFASARMFDYLDEEPRVFYAVAMAKNAVLEERAESLMKIVRERSEKTGRSERLYGHCIYAAESWWRPRAVIFKAEVVRAPGKTPRDNPRFVVTNLEGSDRWVYERRYCERGDVENRIKELHDGLEIDRTSCSRFWANQFRVLLTAAAFTLLQEIRLRAANTSLARAQVTTLRERLFKIGAWVEVSVRRIVLHLPASSPWSREWSRVALALGAG